MRCFPESTKYRFRHRPFWDRLSTYPSIPGQPPPHDRAKASISATEVAFTLTAIGPTAIGPAAAAAAHVSSVRTL